MEEYVAIVHKEKNSDYGVSFPDFPGCVTAGRTLEEAKAMAQEVLEGHITLMREEMLPIPAPSSLDEVVAAMQNKYRKTIHAYFFVNVKAPAKKVTRFNATMEEALLNEVDSTARSLGLTRSGFLAQAARELIEMRRT